MPRYFMRPAPCANHNRGFVALVSVLVIGAVGVALATGLLWGGVGVLRTALTVEQSAQARAFANACVEYALKELRDSTSYAGGETLTFSEGSCDIETIGGSGNTNRTVQATGTAGSVVRRVEVEVAEVAPRMTLTSWQEVAAF